jgi:hypothetical protein
LGYLQSDVAVALGDQLNDLALPHGQQLQLTGRCGVLDNIIKHTFRHLILEAGVVPSQCLHRPNDLLIGLQLEDGSAGARMAVRQ